MRFNKTCKSYETILLLVFVLVLCKYLKILFHKWILTGFPIIATVLNILQIFLCENIYTMGQPPVFKIFSEVAIVHVHLPYLFNIYIMCTTIKLCDRLLLLLYNSLTQVSSQSYHCRCDVMDF